ncbi:hypothetical protein P5V15_009067 [Pogonomyrmex californicus]
MIYNPIWKLWLGPFALVGICQPDDLEKILSSTKHLTKGFIYSFLNPWLGTGLLTSKGTKWHERRKILTPAFHFSILKQFIEILIEEGNHITQSLKNIKGSTVDDLASFIGHHTLNAICETTMGTCLQRMGESQVQYRQAIHEMGNIFVYRLMRPWLAFDSIFALTPMGRKQAKCLKILHGFTEKIIEERKQYHERNNRRYLENFSNKIDKIEADDEEVIGMKKKRLAMLDLLIAVAPDYNMNDLDIREEVDTFVFEGHDTVAMGLTYAILLLAEHKEIQECVRKEVSAIMQANKGKLSMSALNDMSYLERCLKESLRLYPSVPYISRILSEDVKLQSYLVPSGTTIILNVYNIHRDSHFWPNPDVFDPDRFLPEKIQNRHPYSYIPFSAGPRNCIGQRFAMLEMKAIIAPLVYNFYLEPIDYLKDFRFIVDLINRVAHPIRKILTSTKQHLTKGYVSSILKPWLGTGLLTNEGTWHKRRKILTPTFHFNILKQFVEVFIEEGNHITQSLKNIKGSTVDDLVFFISHHTLNAICETTMGTSLHEMGEFEEQYRQSINDLGKILFNRLFKPWLASDIIFALTSMGRKQAKSLKILHGIIEKIIAERKQYYECTNGRNLQNFAKDTDSKEVIGIKKKRLAMLDFLILEARDNKINDVDIKEEIETFIFKGYDTIAMSLTYTMLLLAEHKDIQECVRKEVNAIMQANKGKLSMSALNDMSYLERCLKESLRLYPSIPYIIRTSSEDVQLQSYLVPPGVILYLSIYNVHRDPNFWPNPEMFDPDRFLPEKIQNRHPYSYIPFSTGLRNCIGQQVAMLEMKAIIALLVYNFYLEPIDYLKDLHFVIDLINRVAHPIRIRCVPIDHRP